MDKVAYIVDGGWFTKKFEKAIGRFPTVADTENYINFTNAVLSQKYLSNNSRIYRIFYYDCKPINSKIMNPIDNSIFDLGKSPSYKNNQTLQSGLTQKDFFAVRLGDLKLNKNQGDPWSSWRVNPRKAKTLVNQNLQARDIQPHLSQKGVDMKIGLDIASISVKKLCTVIVLMAGDTDMVPAMKTARKEGVQVCLHTFNNNPHFHLSEHSDLIITHKEIITHADSVSKPF